MPDDPRYPPAPPAPSGGAPAGPKTVKMEAIKDGSYDGFPFHVGDTIEVEEQYVESVQALGMAVRADRVDVADKERKAREDAKKATAAERKNPVTPRKG